MANRIRMTVLATNAEGSPDLYLTFVEATDLQYNEGQHYHMALGPRRRLRPPGTDDCLRPERHGSKRASSRH
ncbi:hypothetical protein [Paraburkholderia sp. JPY419]|uniref:hypothetical protein n=1 Tax=Paraburkholderia sp. JPY419 TaxID=667660 RepID=UPI003D1CF58A